MGRQHLWQNPRAFRCAAAGHLRVLVLLAAHGNHLFRDRLGIDVQARVDAAVIRRLLLPLDGRTWSAQKGDLPRYAETAPEVFLDILEEDPHRQRQWCILFCNLLIACHSVAAVLARV